MGLARALRRERRLRGHNQAEAAAELGVHRLTVSRWECRETEPAELEALAVYLRCSRRDVLDLVEADHGSTAAS